MDELLAKNNLGIKLDVGCGANKQPGFVGIDYRALPGVDIVHNLEQFPWPLPDKCASLASASHVLEHINPHYGDARVKPLIDLLIQTKVITQNMVDAFIGETDNNPRFMRMMDEIWRILKPGGRFAIAVPYPGSVGYWQDPTHLNGVSEATLAYFDPLDTSGLYKIYKPKPWKIVATALDVANNGFMEAILEKRELDPSYE